MIISLAGYMGSGKSHISKLLSDKTGFARVDLDKEIASREGMSVSDIFEKKGEIYFRKQERLVLESLLNEKETPFVLSLGGGTPAYYDNMKLIREKTRSFFLQASITTLCERLLRGQNKRPLVARIPKEELPEFIAKHLFERNAFYSQCEFTLNTNAKDPEEIITEILIRLDLL